MDLDSLGRRVERDWPTIRRAQADAQTHLQSLQKQLSSNGHDKKTFDSEDISIVVFGSLARQEWTSGSDLDWTFLIDGGADHEHANTAQRFGEFLETSGFKKPGRTGIFGNLAFSHNIIHQIGGSDDSNRNTTQRMLLLLESRPVSRREAYDRVITGILRRYLQNDFREFRLKVPRFLLNDLHRFWRTMCVDYASKYRERASDGWAIRNIKLRMSRKLIFAAGLITCYSCDQRLVREINPDLSRDPNVELMVRHLTTFVSRSPLEILIDALCRWGQNSTVQLVLDAYDKFLSKLNDTTVRESLEKLNPTESASSSDFQECQKVSKEFETGLEQFFFCGQERNRRT